MTSFIVKTREGLTALVEGHDGLSLMEVLKRADVGDILALCGGSCSCATCHVYVDPEFLGILGPASEEENDLLEYSVHRQNNSRLACQIRVAKDLDQMNVQVAPED